MIKALADEGRTMILVTHDMRLAADVLGPRRLPAPSAGSRKQGARRPSCSAQPEDRTPAAVPQGDGGMIRSLPGGAEHPGTGKTGGGNARRGGSPAVPTVKNLAPRFSSTAGPTRQQLAVSAGMAHEHESSPSIHCRIDRLDRHRSGAGQHPDGNGGRLSSVQLHQRFRAGRTGSSASWATSCARWPGTDLRPGSPTTGIRSSPTSSAGNYDTIMAGMSITEERDKVIDFTDRITIRRPNPIYVAPSEDDADLKGPA